MNFSFFLLFLITYAAKSIIGNFTFPEGYMKCSVSSNEFDKCALSSFDKLVNAGIRGIPSLDIPSLDPVKIPRAYFRPSSSGAVSMILELDNLFITGYSKLKVISIRGTNITQNVIKMEGFIPHTRIVANFSMKGSILRIPIAGNGTTIINLKNMTLTYKSVHSPARKQGKTYLTVKSIWLDSKIQAGDVSNISSKKKTVLGLSDTDINRALNQNFLAIYEEYKPMINKIMVNVISPSLVKFNDNVAVEDLFMK